MQVLVLYRRICSKTVSCDTRKRVSLTESLTDIFIHQALPKWFKSAVFAEHFFASLNSAVNPIVYGIVNETFRRAITLRFPCLSAILKPLPLSTVSKTTRPSVNRPRSARNNSRPLFFISSLAGKSFKTASTDPESSKHRDSLAMNDVRV